MNFLRAFIPEFLEITRCMVDMMSEKVPFKWNENGHKDFNDIKDAISQALVLKSPNFKKDFIIYCYASKHTLSGILTQKDEKG